MPTRAIVLFTLLLLGACAREDAGQGFQPPRPAAVLAPTESRDVILTRTVPGRTTPFLRAEVRPQVGGIIKERHFREGGTVSEGELLYRLDDMLYSAEVENARGNHARTEATLTNARIAAQRAAKLRETGAVSQQMLDDADAALREAAAAEQAAAAALNAAEVALDYAAIRAPISGVISRSIVTRGALVTANQEAALAIIQQLDPIYVDLTQSSADWLALRAQLEAGELDRTDALPVTLTLEDGQAYEHEGELLFSEVSVDQGTGSFLLRAAFPNPEGLLLPGMHVRATLSLGERRNAVLVPQRAVARDARGEAYVFSIDESQRARRRTLQLGQTVGDQWLVLDGLSAGEKIVVSGIQNLRDGVEVDLRDGAVASATR
jgi:membrane fusion protein (multidrug efflux system)